MSATEFKGNVRGIHPVSRYEVAFERYKGLVIQLKSSLLNVTIDNTARTWSTLSKATIGKRINI